MIEKMEKFDWTVTIKQNIWFLKIVGLWPKDDEAYKANLYTVYAVTTMVLFNVGHNFFQTINLFFIYNDLKAVTATIFVALTHIICVTKAYYLMQNMKILKSLFTRLNSDMFQPKNEQQIALIEPNLRHWKALFLIFWFTAGCTEILWATFPILDKSYKEHRLPFLAWYPHDTKSSPFYEICYMYQVLCMYFIAIVTVSVDTLIAALNMYIGAQCDLLCDNLRSLCSTSSDVNAKLLNSITHHREIVSFAEHSNKFFNWIILSQFFTSAISIGLTMFQMTVVTPFTNQYYSFIAYLIAVTVQIFMYCWFGNEVEVKSARIPYAVFESEWTETSLNFQKKLLFFMLRCQRPIRMSALNLFFLSLETFMRIIRSSWSYFAVLYQVNDEDT